MSPSNRSTGSSLGYQNTSHPFEPDENGHIAKVLTPVQNTFVNTNKKAVNPLTTSKLANQSAPPKKIKTLHVNNDEKVADLNPMDKLLAKLSQQQATMARQRAELKPANTEIGNVDFGGLSTTNMALPATGVETCDADYAQTTTSSDELDAGVAELNRLKMELDRAKNQIARMDQELAHTRGNKSCDVNSISAAGNIALNTKGAPGTHFDDAFSNLNRPFARDSSWKGHDDARSDTSDAMSALSAGGLQRSRSIWAHHQTFGGGHVNMPPLTQYSGIAQPVPGYPTQQWMTDRAYAGQYPGTLPITPGLQTDRSSPDRNMHDVENRGSTRGGGSFGPRNQNSFFGGSSSSYDNMPQSKYATPDDLRFSAGHAGYRPQPIGSALSPFAAEFNAPSPNWKTEDPVEAQTYLPTTEPLNYRRLLDKTVNCNWRYIVDKIVCSNDQQASIFLQQKLKVGTTEQKYDIVESIVSQAYPLMVNRFGNFLVQRCFEHGTPEQVIKIAEAIRGNTLNLSMDAFGCHVVQKAFDSVPENYKAVMVHELLRRIPETVIHRYACHVWQKLFELRWTESPPQIMKYVNDALRGMWHEVALGETGSLVVQNIFENCLEDDKRPCIEEVLEAIDVVAHGQFGNWCIQHICEHGAPADRGRAIDHVIRYATEYSMDQFASKVVEKCLKIGGSEFLHRYLDRVSEGRMDRPRIPLIDISSDQYGNYLIQWILTNASPQDKEMVACHIRKHMVSLRGSKFGSRVGMLCNNPTSVTRPGPGLGTSITPRMPPNMTIGPRFPPSYR